LKKVIFLFLFLSFFAISNSIIAQIHFQLTGKLENFYESSVQLTIYRNWVEDPEEYELKVDKKGGFYANIQLKEMAYCDLNMGEHGFTLWKIEPSDNITITADYLKFNETVTYTGDGAKKWNYLTEQKQVFEIEKDWDYELENLKNVSKKGYFNITNYLYTEQNTLLNKWRDSVSESFFSVQRADIYGKYKALELGYLLNRNIFTEENFSEFDIRVFNSRTQVKSYEFGRFVETLIDNHNKLSAKYQSHALIDYEIIKSYGEKKDLVDKNLMERILALKIINLIEKNPNSEETNLLIASVKEEFSNKAFVNSILNKYASYKKIEYGKQIKTFILPDQNGDLISTKDFKGKFVFISFFTSWCTPCLSDLESINIAKQYFKGKDIVFVFISLDSKVDFDAYMRSYSPQGTYLLGFNDAIIKNELKIESVPKYILLNKDSYIISSTFDDPSADEGRLLIKQIEDELIK
jgi:peroxiredoxin